MELEGVNFKVTAETGQLNEAEADMRQFAAEADDAQKSVDRFGNELKQADKDAGRFIDSTGRMREKTGGYVKTADDATKSTSKLGSELDKTGKSTKAFTNDLTGMDAAALTAVKSMGVLAGAAGGYTIALANNVKEQQAWASAVGVSLQTMQGWGAAAKTVGRDVDFIGDVFKDANEKIGDFVATGGGEAKDVFEQLNIQATELKNLSPDQQLLRIAEGLEDVQTRGEKLFILESLANDASLLLPLLEDNARGLKDVTDQAERLGVVMSDADASMLREVANEWTALTQSVQGFGNTLATQYAEDVAGTLNSISGGIQTLTGFIDDNGESLRIAGLMLTGAVAGYGAYVTATKAATLVTVGFNAALSTNPLGLLARGLAVAGGALATYMLTKENATELERDNTNAIYGNINAIALQSKETRESAIASLELKKSQIQTELESRRVEQAAFQQRVSEIAALRDAYGQTAENIELFNQSILNLALTQENSAEVQAQLEQQLADTEDRISQLRDTFTKTIPVVRASSDAIDDYAKLHDSLSMALAGSNKPMVEYQKTLDAINALEVDAAKKAQLRQMAERRLNIELAKQAKTQRELAGQLDVTTAAYNSYYDIVQQIVDSGADQETQAALLSKAYHALGQDLADIAEEAEKAKDKADPYAQAWEEATKRIDDSFSKAWEGAFDSFESFADSIMDSFKTLLANLAHQAITKPILISMGFGGGDGTGGLGGIGSLFSGSQSGGIGSIFNTGSMLNNAYQFTQGQGAWYNALANSPVGGWLGMTGAAATNAAGYTAFQSAFPATSSYLSGLGGAGATTGATTATTGLQGLGGTATSTAGGAGAGAGMSATTGAALVVAIPLIAQWVDSITGGGQSASVALGNMSDETYRRYMQDAAIIESAREDYFNDPSWELEGGRPTFLRPDSNITGGGDRLSVGISGSADKFSDASVETPFGRFGVLTNTKTDAEDFMSVLELAKSMDEMLASAISEMDIQNVSAALSDWAYSGVAERPDVDTTHPGKIERQLRARLYVQLDAIDEELSDFVQTVGKDIPWQDFERFSKESNLAIMALELQDVIDIVDIGIDAFAEMSVEGEHLVDTITRTVSDMMTVRDISESIGINFSALGNGMLQASNNIVEMVGGIGNFATIATNYIDLFKQQSTGEQFNSLAQAIGSTFAAIDYAVPVTRDGFTSLVESLDLSSEAGQEAYVALLNASTAMSVFYQSIDDVIASIAGLTNLSQSIRESMMAEDEYYNYLRDQAHALSDAIGTLTDPEQIMQTVESIENLVSRMWGTLDESQQQLLGADFISYLDEVAQIAGDRLDQIVDENLGTGAESFISTEEANAQRNEEASARLAEAAERSYEAAERNYEAAERMAESVSRFETAISTMGGRNGFAGFGGAEVVQ